MIFLYVHVLSQNGFKKRNYVMKINIVMNPAFHQNSFKMHKKWINSLIKKKIKIDYLRVKIKTYFKCHISYILFSRYKIKYIYHNQHLTWRSNERVWTLEKKFGNAINRRQSHRARFLESWHSHEKMPNTLGGDGATEFQVPYTAKHLNCIYKVLQSYNKVGFNKK